LPLEVAGRFYEDMHAYFAASGVKPDEIASRQLRVLRAI
jgi:hypothetical protein